MAVHQPTPEEIAAACAEIRRHWPQGERFRRQGLDPHYDTVKGAARQVEHSAESAHVIDES
jgi:hypothetical protein